MRYAFDIDGTICDLTKDNDYSKSLPFQDVVDSINLLHQQGHYIIIFTARGGRSGRDWHDTTVNQLSNWGVKYHELVDKGKPNVDIFIDDKAINASDWWAKIKNKSEIGIASGYFNPLHLGHLQYLNEAKERCKYLMVIVNSDLQVGLKKSKPFMNEAHRQQIMQNLKAVDECIISIDSDKAQVKTLAKIKLENPNSTISFFNSGDRKAGNLEPLESIFCKENNIFEIVLDLPKIYSSSDLLNL